jgi:hypothetical protein
LPEQREINWDSEHFRWASQMSKLQPVSPRGKEDITS